MLSSTRLDGRVAIRLCSLNWRTSADDVEAALEEVRGAGRRVEGEFPPAIVHPT